MDTALAPPDPAPGHEDAATRSPGSPGHVATIHRGSAPTGARPHVQLAHRFLDAFNAADATELTTCLSEQATLRVLGTHQLAGTFTGRAAVMGHVRRMWHQQHSVWRVVSCDDWLVSDQRVLAITTMHVQLPGRFRDWRRCLLFDVPLATVRPPHELRIEHLQIFEDDDQDLVDAFIDRTQLT